MPDNGPFSRQPSGNLPGRRPAVLRTRLRPAVDACVCLTAFLAGSARADDYPSSGNQIYVTSGEHVFTGSGNVNVSGKRAIEIRATGSDASVTIDPAGGTVNLTSSIGVVQVGTSGKNASLVIGPGAVNIVGQNAYYAIGVNASASGTNTSTVQLGPGVSIVTSGYGGYGIWSTSRASITADGVSVSTSGTGAIGAGVVGDGTLKLTNSSIVTGAAGAGSGLGAGGLANSFSHGTYVDASALEAINVSVTTHGDDAAGLAADGSGASFLENVVTDTHGANSPGVYAADGAQVWVSSGTTGPKSSFTTSGPGSHGVDLENATASQTSVTAAGSTFHATGIGSYGAFLTGISGSTELLSLSDSQLLSDQSDAIRVVGPAASISLTDNSSVTAGLGAAALNVMASGTAPGQVQLTADHSTMTGAILTDATSTSNVSLNNGSLWNVTGDSTLTNLTNSQSSVVFVPASQLSSAPTSPSSYRTVTVSGNYSGDNGVVRLNSFLNQGGSLANQFTDRLLVSGNAAGTTVVEVEPVPGSVGAITSPTGVITATEGISIIQVAGSSTAGAFHLQGGYVTAAGSPYQYRLNAYGPTSSHGNSDPTQSLVGNAGNSWDYRLQTAYVTPNGPVDPDEPDSPVPVPEENVAVPPDARLAVAPQIASYVTAPAALLYAGLADIDTLHRRLGEVRDDRDLGRDQDGPGEVFIRAYGGHFDYSTNVGFKGFGYNATGDYSAIQLGGNVFRHRDDNNGIWRFGMAATLGWLHYEPEAVDGPSSSRTNTFRLSGYGTYQSQQGWYVDGILSVGWFDGDISTSARGETFNLNGTGYAASLEAGYPFAVGAGFNIEPQLQLVGQHLSFRNDTDADELPVNIGSQNQLLGRLGARVTRPFDYSNGRITPYAAVDVLHSFTGGTNVTAGGATFASGDYGGALQVSLGINGTVSKKTSVYGRATWQHSLGDAGFRGWLFNAGARILF